jgi:hypothetical protein
VIAGIVAAGRRGSTRAGPRRWAFARRPRSTRSSRRMWRTSWAACCRHDRGAGRAALRARLRALPGARDGRVIGISGLSGAADGGSKRADRHRSAGDAAAAAAEDRLEVLACGPEHLPQLARIAPADIDLLVITHGHIDHVGGIGDFPGVPIVIGAADAAAELLGRGAADGLARGGVRDTGGGPAGLPRAAAPAGTGTHAGASAALVHLPVTGRCC